MRPGSDNTLTFDKTIGLFVGLVPKDNLQQCSLLFPGLSDVSRTTEQLTFDLDLA